MTLAALKKELQGLADTKQAEVLQGFFKTGKGQYGQGDVFLGIKVPVQRKVAKKYQYLTPEEIQKLLASKIHEHRLIALLILVLQYQKADPLAKKEIFNLYLRNTRRINNWDLVDLSAPAIVGNYLLDKKGDVLYRLARSADLWEKRIAILSTFEFIKNGQTQDTFAIAEILLKDRHDLIHKAVGWMLREAGKRVSQEEEEQFLREYHKVMPRTMLRYAIERFSPEKKKFYRGK
jgi:3-methyladenine DNA glycosylase AlkD